MFVLCITCQIMILYSFHVLLMNLVTCKVLDIIYFARCVIELVGAEYVKLMLTF